VSAELESDMDLVFLGELIFTYNALLHRFSSGKRLDSDMKYLFLGYASGSKSFLDILNAFGEPSVGTDEKEFQKKTFLRAIYHLNSKCDSFPLEDDYGKRDDVKKIIDSYVEGKIDFGEFDRQIQDLDIVSSLI
jgi:hypothetical protein